MPDDTGFNVYVVDNLEDRNYMVEFLNCGGSLGFRDDWDWWW